MAAVPERTLGGGPVRQGALRAHNLALALREVQWASTPVSRADIAAATGMSRATASSLVDALVVGGLVREAGLTARAGAGRPATGLVLATDGPAGLGLEVNVDYVAACVVDLTGAVRHRSVIAGDQRGLTPRRAVGRLARLARVARDTVAGQGLVLCGAALALPGLVRAPDGPLALAPNLGWRDVDVLALARGSRGLADLPLTVDNEANLAALAELYAASGGGSFLHVSGEIGIGSGIVLDGRLFRGRHGWSGELGHVTVHPDGPACTCGSRGCLEQYAGLEAILRTAGLPPPAGGTSLGGEPAVARVLDAARAGSPRMLGALAQAGTSLGIVLAGALNLLDVDAVVLGGVYGPLSAWLTAPVEREVSRRLLSAPWAGVTIRPSVLDADAAVVGAAQSVVRATLDDPARWLAGMRS